MSPCVRLLSPFVRKISSLSPAILACEKSARNFTIARRHWLLCRPRPKPPPPLSNLLTFPSMSRHPLLFVDVMLYRLREQHPVEMLKAFMRLLLVVVFPPALMVFVAAMVHGGARMDITGNDRVWLVGMAFVVGVILGAVPLPGLFIYKQALNRKIGVGAPLPYSYTRGCIYLDYNATSPIFPEVTQEMLPFTGSCFGNPSSAHALGRTCKVAVDKARARLAALLGCTSDEVVFVASGSEADNHAIVAALTLYAKRRASVHPGPKPHVVSSGVEHPAISKCLDHLEAEGKVEVTYVQVDEEGRVSLEDVVTAFRPETALVTVMHSNNEVGSLQPVKEIAAACRQRGILCHTDAAQSVGKVSVKVDDLGVDMLTLVGHKFGAPKGVAALFVRRGLALPPMIHGGGQERGRRAGTENVLLISGMGKAAEIVDLELEKLSSHLKMMRERLLGRLMSTELGERIHVHGPKDACLRLPNTLSFGIPGLEARLLLEKLSETVAASAGSACHTGGSTVSSVLRAMGVDKATGLGTLRLSVGRHTTEREIDQAAAAIVREARAMLAAV